ncbi:MAG: taurine dioxygenase [Balneolaceae bacterium]|nr:taurine dioxygenase [Balneolaceae bacterium]
MEKESTQEYTFKYVDYDKIDDMLYGDKEYIHEFSEAAIQSFEEFSNHYKKYILAKDETSFRKAGHKIKPVAQMIGISTIVEEYEHGKELIQDDAKKEDLTLSAEKIEDIVTQVIEDLNWICEKSK